MDCEINSNITEAKVVLLCGVSGSGKTTFANRLSQYGFSRISGDGLIWREYGDCFPSLPQEAQKEAFMQLGRKIAYELDKALRAGEKTVVDATLCKRAKRDELREICLAHGVTPVLVYLTAPLEVLSQRLAGRTGNGPDDQIVSSAQLKSYFANFAIPSPEENPLVIECNSK